MKNQNNKKLAQEWLNKAEDTWKFTQAGWEETSISSESCFGCQQTVEKYLKGYLVSQGIKPERTHILSDLLMECRKIDKNFEKIAGECEVLTEYYNPSRYPMDVLGSFPQDKGGEAIKMTQKVIRFIKGRI